MPKVIAVGNEVAGQGIEQALVRRRVGEREIVDRLDQAGAKVDRPETVDETAREVRVVRPDQPLEELRACVAMIVNHGPTQDLGGQGAVRLRVGQAPQLLVADINLT